MGAHSSGCNDGLPNHFTRQRGAAVRAGVVKTGRPIMSVEMLSPSAATEVCGADEGRYNAGAVLPQGAFDVQSIRASQTADPRAKQTHPFGPARRSARVNSRSGDGDSPPGSMPAGRFHLEEVVESFLGQPLLAGLPAAALQRASPPRTWAGVGSTSTSRPRPSSWSIFACSGPWATCSTTGLVTARTDIPRQTDIYAPVPYRQNKHFCSASRGAGATGAAASSRSASWRLTTSFPAAAARTTSKTCSCCVDIAIASRATGRKNTSWPGCGSWGLRRELDYGQLGKAQLAHGWLCLLPCRSSIAVCTMTDIRLAT